jgi:hypothetical protein
MMTNKRNIINGVGFFPPYYLLVTLINVRYLYARDILKDEGG